MALEDEDRQEIARMISESRPAPPAPTRTRQDPAGPPGGRISEDEWDGLNSLQRQKLVRSWVQDELAAQDAEVERQELRAEVEELRKAKAEWEKSGRRGPRPTAATVPGSAGKRPEETPTLVSRAYTWLFGSTTAPS